MIHSNRGGFTVFEVLIASTIFMSILFVTASFRQNLDALQNLAGQKLESRQDLDQTFQILVSEIRSAGPSSLGAYPIESAASSSFVFYSDIDKDGIFERVRYFYGTSTLEKGVVEPSGNPLVYATSTEVIKTVADYVVVSSTVPLFEYFGPDYTGTEAALVLPVDITEIRLVRARILADINPQKAPIPVLFTDTVNIRNLRSN